MKDGLLFFIRTSLLLRQFALDRTEIKSPEHDIDNAVGAENTAVGAGLMVISFPHRT